MNSHLYLYELRRSARFNYAPEHLWVSVCVRGYASPSPPLSRLATETRPLDAASRPTSTTTSYSLAEQPLGTHSYEASLLLRFSVISRVRQGRKTKVMCVIHFIYLLINSHDTLAVNTHNIMKSNNTTSSAFILRPVAGTENIVDNLNARARKVTQFHSPP